MAAGTLWETVGLRDEDPPLVTLRDRVSRVVGAERVENGANFPIYRRFA